MERIAELDNICLAYMKARRGKRCKVEVLEFEEHFDDNIGNLRRQLTSGTVDVGHYHYFTIYDPKERVICAAPFRERVLHHAIMNVCHDHFERSLIDTTYASRPGKGVYAALDKAMAAAARYAFMVKLDVRKYFDSIDHSVLKGMLQRTFKDRRLLGIFGQIIDSYHADTGCGLPIGNLTSQYFANMYLSAVDHMAKERLGAPLYIRYMDDILIAADDKDALRSMVAAIDAYVREELHMQLKPPVMQPSRLGMPFLGYRVMPHRLLLAGRSKRRFRTKLNKYDRLLATGVWGEQEYVGHTLPLLAFAQHADSWQFRTECLRNTYRD